MCLEDTPEWGCWKLAIRIKGVENREQHGFGNYFYSFEPSFVRVSILILVCSEITLPAMELPGGKDIAILFSGA
jgi:hypothetical protein